MIRVLTLSLLIHCAVIRPAGPAPTMRTSILEVLAVELPMVNLARCLRSMNKFVDTQFERHQSEEVRNDVGLQPQYIDTIWRAGLHAILFRL